MRDIVSHIVLTAALLSCLGSCGKSESMTGQEEEKEIHPYKIELPADGLDKKVFLEYCVKLTSSIRYDYSVDDDWDWIEIINVEKKDGTVIPYINVALNDTGKTRSTEVVIQSSSSSSHIFNDKHLLVQPPKQ